MTVVLRHVVGPPEYLGALSIARHARAFDCSEAELLEYVAGGTRCSRTWRACFATSRATSKPPPATGVRRWAVILPETDLPGAAQVAERMREAVASMQVPGAGGGGSLA
jgi:hypothetical protein